MRVFFGFLLASVSASLAVNSTASKHLHNDLAKAIEALEQKKYLPVLSLSALFLRVAAGTCLVLRFWRFSACTFSFGSVLAVCCWYLLGGFFGGSLPVLSLSAPFLRFAAGTCLVVRFWRFSACTFSFSLQFPARTCLVVRFGGSLPVLSLSAPFLRFAVSFGSVLAVCCWYLLGGSFLAVLCLYFLFRLCSCGLLLVPAWWFVFGGSLPVLSLSALFLRFAAGTCLVVRFWRFSACTFSFGSVLAVCCWYLLGGSLLTVPCLYFLFGSVLAVCC